MKNIVLLLILVGLVIAGWMNREKLPWFKGEVPPPEVEEEMPVPEQPSSQRPTVTVNPAAEARATAMRVYPGLAIKDSAFNKKFVALYNEAQQSDPALLSRPDWPLKLAERTAVALGGAPMPTPGPPPPVKRSALPGSALDRKPPH